MFTLLLEGGKAAKGNVEGLAAKRLVAHAYLIRPPRSGPIRSLAIDTVAVTARGNYYS
jgi:hypothetical protein